MKHQELTDKIIAAFYDVYNELGHGYLESVYQRSMAIALSEAGLQVIEQAPITVYFHGQVVGHFCADLLVNCQVIVELKAARAMESSFEAQLLHYLRATDIEVGLLMNSGNKPEFKRFLYDNERKARRQKLTGATDYTDQHGSLQG